MWLGQPGFIVIPLNPPQNGEGDRPKGGGGGWPRHAAPRQDASPHHHAAHGPPPRTGEDLVGANEIHF